MNARVADLLRFLDASPTPFHAVAEVRRRLEAAGFVELREEEAFRLGPGDSGFVVRSGASLVAFQVGSAPPSSAGFRFVGAHTDSPTLRVKPCPDVMANGYRQVAVEPYGGLLLHTWLDRDLSIAGRVVVATPDGPRTELLAFGRPLLRIPNLAIHLQRELAQDGLKLNAQQHAVGIVGLDGTPDLADLVASELSLRRGAPLRPVDVLGFDLVLHDVQPACVLGARDELVSSARLDNLASCHAAVSALIESAGANANSASTRGIVLYDHEEVGSRSARGAGGTLLVETFDRIVACVEAGEPQALARSLARSRLVSADVAHAVHPNYADRHEPGHRPVIGCGPVLKTNANQSYATDAETAAEIVAVGRERGIALQHFVARSDLGCGSTIGPITASRAGIRTVDLGIPLLAMHSCRELAGAGDLEPMIALLAGFFASDR